MSQLEHSLCGLIRYRNRHTYFGTMEQFLSVKVLFCTALLLVWTRQALSQLDEGATQCISSPTGEVDFTAHVRGVPGAEGPKGEKGNNGSIGPRGLKGDTGLQGEQGDRGDTGIVGLPGQKGEEGSSGQKGEPGDTVLTAEEFNKVIETLKDTLCMMGQYKGFPAASCKEVYDCNRNAPSGYYWISGTDCQPQRLYCEMNTTRCGNITGGWTRVAHIDMKEPQQTCPSPLRTLTSPKRMCVQQQTAAGCTSVQYSTLGVPFTQICGQAAGYMYCSPDGLDAIGTTKTIDNPYVDGLSITYSSPRRHVWSYAAGHIQRCLCHPNSYASQPPSFVGQHYYCDGWPRPYSCGWYPQYRLWDGEGCPTGNTCCNPPNLPWFHRTLNTATTEDIEVRWCRDQASNDERVGVELMELYIY